MVLKTLVLYFSTIAFRFLSDFFEKVMKAYSLQNFTTPEEQDCISTAKNQSARTPSQIFTRTEATNVGGFKELKIVSTLCENKILLSRLR